MASVTVQDGLSQRIPKLDERRFVALAVRTDPQGSEFDPRAARTTVHLLDEDSDETTAADACVILADEPDVYGVYLVLGTVWEEFEGRAKVAIDAGIQARASAAMTAKKQVSATAPTSTPGTSAPPHTPAPAPVPANPPVNRGLRLENPKGESWRK